MASTAPHLTYKRLLGFHAPKDYSAHRRCYLKSKAYLVLIVVALLCVVGWTGYGQNQRSESRVWEYKHIHPFHPEWVKDDSTGEATFNRLGAQGWELVGIEARENAVTSYYFKRAR